MPTSTVQATVVTTPNPDVGGSAVTSETLTGHGATLSSITGVGTVNKTCKWLTFPGVPGTVYGVRVKFDWVRNGALGAGCSNVWQVQCGFGLNVGEIETAITESNVTGSSSGSVNFSLTGARIKQPSDLFVSDAISATGAIAQTASLTITISNLQLEVDWQQAAVIVMM